MHNKLSVSDLVGPPRKKAKYAKMCSKCEEDPCTCEDGGDSGDEDRKVTQKYKDKSIEIKLSVLLPNTEDSDDSPSY